MVAEGNIFLTFGLTAMTSEPLARGMLNLVCRETKTSVQYSELLFHSFKAMDMCKL
jgi:hypothetical protein